MKRLFTILLFSISIVQLYCQKSKVFAPQKGDWGISTDASNIFKFINGNPSEEIMRGKYLFSDQFAIMGGVGFANYSYSEHQDSHSTKAMRIELGGQYFFNSDKRIRPFAGVNISYSAGVDKEKNESTSNFDIFTSPFYAYLGIGAECFITRCISLSTDFGVGIACSIERTETIMGNGDVVINHMDWIFSYATGTGGLGGKLALNIYF